MEGFEQTPPEGLWEAVEARLPRRRAAAFPWWWALAGAAAALLTVVLIWNPAPRVQADAVAVVDIVDQPSEVPGQPEPSEPVPVIDAEDVAPQPSGEEPVSHYVSAPKFSAVPSVSDNSDNSDNSGNAVNAEADDSKTDAADAQPDESVVDESAADESAAGETQPDKSDVADTEPDGHDAADIHQGKQDSSPESDITTTPPFDNIVPQPTVRRSKPSMSAKLIAGGLPGSASHSFNGYGVTAASTGKAVMANQSASLAPAAILSRNKPSSTDVSHSVALRVGALFNYSFSEHWGVETGLQLTNLQTRTKTTTGSVTSATDKTISYIGLPLMVVYTPLRFERLSLYTSAGPMFEYGFRSFGKQENYLGSEKVEETKFTGKESDAVFSLGLNLGAQWMVTDFGGLFLQPGLSWHLVGDGNTETFYTEHPLSFSVSAGFRFLF